MSSYTKVLVGTDGSASATRAVERAARVAADAGATLLIASAFQPISDRDRQAAINQLGNDAYKVMGSNPAEEALRDAEALAHKNGVEKVETVAEAGDPVDVLVALIDGRKVDLCIVGNRGLNSLAGRLLGSVPANISHRASCDVLIVHTTGGGK
ncbi:MAG: universal stress protein [Frankiaceae bacterium]|nr:universal stress protein [Frankiaceae bacterium]MBV9869147.1 universal stress protein [Frankiaceae bacterium]